MRELTKKEQELLTGGSGTLGTIYVTAPAFNWDFGYSFDLGNDPFDYVYDYNDGAGGGGDPVYDCNSTDNTAVERFTDAKAAQLARSIIAKTDHMSNEYLAFIYRDGLGVLRSSQIFGAGTSRVDIDFQNLGFPVSQIVAVIHNHDRADYGYDAASADINQRLSQNDWATADRLVQAGASASELSFYLLDTQDTFRQYNYTDKGRYVNSDGTIKYSAPLGTTSSKTATPSSCPL